MEVAFGASVNDYWQRSMEVTGTFFINCAQLCLSANNCAQLCLSAINCAQLCLSAIEHFL